MTHRHQGQVVIHPSFFERLFTPGTQYHFIQGIHPKAMVQRSWVDQETRCLHLVLILPIGVTDPRFAPVERFAIPPSIAFFDKNGWVDGYANRKRSVGKDEWSRTNPVRDDQGEKCGFCKSHEPNVFQEDHFDEKGLCRYRGRPDLDTLGQEGSIIMESGNVVKVESNPDTNIRGFSPENIRYVDGDLFDPPEDVVGHVVGTVTDGDTIQPIALLQEEE